MAFRSQTGEYGADTTPASNSEYLRALKRNNESRIPIDPAPSATAAPQATPEEESGSSPAADKRRSPRYKCEGSVEFRTEGVDVRTWARVTDISRTGCYVEMQATSPLNSAVSLVMDVSGIRVHVKGTVRTCYPLLGMGIAFTEISDEDRLQLEEILHRLASGFSPPVPELRLLTAPDLLMITNAGAALTAVATFFQNNRTLSREQFTELVGESQSRNVRKDR
jgi:hypothetical protein